MKRHHAARCDAASINRQKLLQALQPYYELDMTSNTAPFGMMCPGLADKLGRNVSHVYLDMRWLRARDYVKVLGKRHPEGKTDSRESCLVYMLTAKGREAVKNH